MDIAASTAQDANRIDAHIEFSFRRDIHRIAPLQIIAQQEMGIEDLDRHLQLKSARLTYQLGVEA